MVKVINPHSEVANKVTFSVPSSSTDLPQTPTSTIGSAQCYRQGILFYYLTPSSEFKAKKLDEVKRILKSLYVQNYGSKKRSSIFGIKSVKFSKDYVNIPFDSFANTEYSIQIFCEDLH